MRVHAVLLHILGERGDSSEFFTQRRHNFSDKQLQKPFSNDRAQEVQSSKPPAAEKKIGLWLLHAHRVDKNIESLSIRT